jgi:hypothetical protein
MPCTHKFILKLGKVLNDYDANTVVVNPRKRVYQSSVFKDFEMFSMYSEAMKDETVDAVYSVHTNTYSIPIKIIHVKTPNFEQDSYQDLLEKAYRNVFLEFFQHASDNDTLRLVPLTNGDLTEIGITNDDLATMEINALFDALQISEIVRENLTKGRKVFKKIKNIDFYVDNEAMYRSFLKTLPKDKQIVL